MDPMRKSLMKAGIAGHVAVYRLTDGRVGAQMGGARVILVTSKGRTTGKLRTSPVMRIDHDGATHVIASAGGAPDHPAWFRNIEADPRVRVRDGDETWSALAVVLEGTERDEAYAAAVAEMEGFAAYEERTDRTIPVVRLEPFEPDDAGSQAA